MFLKDFEATVDFNAVRVLCDWAALPEETSANILTLTADQPGLYTPWYLGDAGEISYQDATEKPLTVEEAVDNFELLDAERKQWLETINGAQLVVQPVPCYRLPDNSLLLMDGNHRVVSARRYSDLTFYGLVIDGPLDPAVLPDLKFWT